MTQVVRIGLREKGEDAMATQTLSLRASDVSGQKTARIRNCPKDASVRELVEAVMHKLDLPKNDSSGAAVMYQARLDRAGRSLHESEIVGEVLKPEDRIVLTPNVDAGRGR